MIVYRTSASTTDHIVVTGIGTILPGTQDVQDFWTHVSDGNSQVGALTRFDSQALGLAVHASAEITAFDHRRYLPNLPDAHAAKYSREILIAMSAIAAAMNDAGLRRDDVPAQKLSIIQSSSRGPLAWWQSAMTDQAETAPYGDNGAMFRGLPGCPATMAAIYLGAQGLVSTISSACVGGHHAIGSALNELRAGRADVVLAGGHEFPILAEVARCYLALGSGVLSTEREDPSRAVRPYNIDREGFALGEGATSLCLERESSARARGARIYARVLGHAPTNEAAHGTSMDMTGEVTAATMSKLLKDVDRHRDQVGYVCGHGTATRYNDLAESRALRALYPDRDDSALPPHGSNKPIYGHTFGMAGAINVAATSLMLYRQRLARTANLDAPDPECDTDHVAEGPRDADIDVALSMTFAFGSQTSIMAMEGA